jgi:exosortase D (VPLPA-CTERM-specific)
VLFRDGIGFMTTKWEADEYNHGWMIPPVALYLVWCRAQLLSAIAAGGSWWGVPVILAGLALLVLGDMSSVAAISQYGLVVAIWGLALAATGARGLRILWVPLVYLLFMVPLPNFLETRLTAGLMLQSSRLGVEVIRLAGYPVFLEGNVIDLGIYKLQVAEACSGMRYLFPLMSFGFLCAVLFRGQWWQRTLLFVATVPITLVMNSFRIGVIGILVNNFGIEQAEGFIHDFEGWVVFMACVAILLLMIMGFARMERKPFLHIFGLDIPPWSDLGNLLGRSRPPAALLTAVGGLVLAATVSATVPKRATVLPERTALATFPLQMGPWTGTELPLEQVYLDVLKLSDHLLASFQKPGEQIPVGLWIAYYDSQSQGASVHSPQACLPGGGWQITRFGVQDVPGVGPGGESLRVNRAEVSLGEQRQLVYYWFAQRGRELTDEFAVKWYIVQDGITMNRTDGALVRLTTYAGDADAVAAADARLQEFLRLAHPRLAYHLPGKTAVPRRAAATTPASTSL